MVPFKMAPIDADDQYIKEETIEGDQKRSIPMLTLSYDDQEYPIGQLTNTAFYPITRDGTAFLQQHNCSNSADFINRELHKMEIGTLFRSQLNEFGGNPSHYEDDMYHQSVRYCDFIPKIIPYAMNPKCVRNSTCLSWDGNTHPEDSLWGDNINIFISITTYALRDDITGTPIYTGYVASSIIALKPNGTGIVTFMLQDALHHGPDIDLRYAKYDGNNVNSQSCIASYNAGTQIYDGSLRINNLTFEEQDLYPLIVLYTRLTNLSREQNPFL
jgi:hypothetical protein